MLKDHSAPSSERRTRPGRVFMSFSSRQSFNACACHRHRPPAAAPPPPCLPPPCPSCARRRHALRLHAFAPRLGNLLTFSGADVAKAGRIPRPVVHSCCGPGLPAGRSIFRTLWRGGFFVPSNRYYRLAFEIRLLDAGPGFKPSLISFCGRPSPCRTFRQACSLGPFLDRTPCCAYCCDRRN